MPELVAKRAKAGGLKRKEKLRDPIFRAQYSRNLSRSLLESYRNGTKQAPILSKKHYEKIGRLNSKRQAGNGNSRYGTKWISNIKLKKSKSVKNEVVKKYLEQGWTIGRKFNSH